MYLMVEFRCVKCDDKEYGIVYYEKVFSLELFMVSKVEGRGNIKKKLLLLLLGWIIWLQDGSRQLSAAVVFIYIYIYTHTHTHTQIKSFS